MTSIKRLLVAILLLVGVSAHGGVVIYIADVGSTIRQLHSPYASAIVESSDHPQLHTPNGYAAEQK